MENNKRFGSLDFLRGFALISVIFFHTSVYNYANIHKIDFSNPPIAVVLISFLVLWGGLLIFYSGVVNSFMLSKRTDKEFAFVHTKHLLYAGGLLIVFHFLLNIIFGRWSNDFVNNQPDMTFVANSIRSMQFSLPHLTKYFEGSSLSTIAFNLIIVSLIVYFLLRDNGIKKVGRNQLILGGLGFIIMLLSFVRVYVYKWLPSAIESKNYALALLFSFTIANPYPLLPYLAYGMFGVMIGLMIYLRRNDLLKHVMLPIGGFFLIFGIIGTLNFEKTISTPDFFWYYKTQLELGVFILAAVIVFLTLEKREQITNKLAFIKWFSRVSLTVYMLETLVSEIFRKILDVTIPMWNQTINGCLMFGASNVILWVIILYFWSRARFKYSLEYYWVRLFTKLDKKSTKMDELE